MVRALGTYGCILAVLTLLALCSGRLNLDAHGFGIVIFSQAVWFILAGVLLLRGENQHGENQHDEEQVGPATV